MGEIVWGLPVGLVEAIQNRMQYRYAVETGTYRGDSTQLLVRLFDSVVSVEVNRNLAEAASERFKGSSNVRIVQGRSEDVLPGILRRQLDAPGLFWLDAHWFRDLGHDSSGPQCPLLGEIKAIREWSRAASSTVIVDDANMFMARLAAPFRRSEWPQFLEIVDALRFSPDTYMTIIEDCFIAGPREVEQALDRYWLERQPVPDEAFRTAALDALKDDR